MVIAHGIRNTGTHQDRMVPKLDAIERWTGQPPDKLSAVPVFCSHDRLKALEERIIRGYVANGYRRHGTQSATGTGPVQAECSLAAKRLRLGRGETAAAKRMRRITIKPALRQIRQARGFRQFLLRSRRKLCLEWVLIRSTHIPHRLHGDRNVQPAFGGAGNPAGALLRQTTEHYRPGHQSGR